MTYYQTKLIRKQIIARETMSFWFEKPTGFEYLAGQAVDLTLINPPETDEKGETRTFSLASSPQEKDLMIATRLRPTAFKRVLSASLPGTKVSLSAPMGSLTVDEKTAKILVFIAGGIGITPFRSMLLDLTERQSLLPVCLFYANRTPEDAPFLDELIKLSGKNHWFTFIPTMTKPENAGIVWQGEAGYIDEVKLKKYLGDVFLPTYYLAGPPAMVQGMYNLLIGLKIGPEKIIFEEFTGY